MRIILILILLMVASCNETPKSNIEPIVIDCINLTISECGQKVDSVLAK